MLGLDKGSWECLGSLRRTLTAFAKPISLWVSMATKKFPAFDSQDCCDVYFRATRREILYVMAKQFYSCIRG